MTRFGFGRLRQRIGLGVSTDRVRALAMVGADVVWACERAKGAEETLEEALRDLIACAPISRWRRRSTFVALGPAIARVKRLSRLPPVADKALAYQLVRENADRFFPRQHGQTTVRAVECNGGDETWAVVVDDPTVAMVERVCVSTRLRLRSFVPAIAAVAAATDDAEFEVADGPVRVAVQTNTGRLAIVRYRQRTDGAIPAQTLASVVARLRPLGIDAATYADAYGAIALGAASRLGFCSDASPAANKRSIPRWRRAAAVAALGLGIAAPFVAPVAAAGRAVTRDEALLRSLGKRARAARVTYADLLRFTAANDAAASFANSRRSRSVLLAQLTKTLPGGTAIVSLRVDSAGGSLVVIGQRATGALSSLEKVDAVKNSRLAGPVTRELVAGREMERASIHFVFSTGAAIQAEATPPSASLGGRR